jgi:hypothetical protein
MLLFIYSTHSSHAWIGLIAETGDILNISKWNQMIAELNNKLETSNIQAGAGININTSGNNVTISTSSSANIQTDTISVAA